MMVFATAILRALEITATSERAGGAFETTVVGTATALAPALALWLASPEAPTQAYAQGWQPAVAD